MSRPTGTVANFLLKKDLTATHCDLLSYSAVRERARARDSPIAQRDFTRSHGILLKPLPRSISATFTRSSGHGQQRMAHSVCTSTALRTPEPLNR